MDKLIKIIGVCLSVWCLFYLGRITEYFGIIITPTQHQGVFFGLVMFLTFLVFPAKKGKPGVKWYDWILIIMGVVPCFYVALFYDLWLLHSSTTTQPYEIVFAVALLIALLEGLRRVLGIILPILTLFFLIQPVLGEFLPGFLFSRSYSVERVLTITYASGDGIFSLPMNIAGTIVIIFLIFGQLLLVTGGGQALIDLAYSMTGRVKGGGAKAAVVASAFFGTFSGSPAANTAITGTFTIPLMKSTGYKPEFAAGVEASASTGGTVLPPVMGSVAFIMAEWLQVPYIHIAKIAFFPALILYICILLQVHFAAERDGLQRLPASSLPPFLESLQQSLIYLIPISILIYLLFGLRYTPDTSAFWATMSIPVVTAFRKKTRIDRNRTTTAFSESARAGVTVGLACAMAGLMMGSVGMTGIAASLSDTLVNISGGSTFAILLLGAFASFLFGMGIGSIPSYIFVAIMVAPALTKVGITLIAAHLFVFWFAMSAFITPPVCVSAYIAAAIAQCSAMKAGLQAIRVGIGFLIIPFAFMYNQGLILQGSAMEIVGALFSVIVAIVG